MDPHPGPLEIWVDLMREANQFLEHGELRRALAIYEAARVFMLHHFEQWPDADEALAALVVSHLDLADAQARAGWLDEAAAGLCDVHCSLLTLMRDARQGTAVRQGAARHMRETFLALVRFQAVHGERPDITQLLRRHGRATRLSSASDARGEAGAVAAAMPRTLH